LYHDSLTIAQLLEGIGAISATESRKAMSRSGNYQDSVTAPLGLAFDDEALGKHNEDEQDETNPEVGRPEHILTAVEKVGITST
jgi:hypothetical protein